MIIRCLPSKCEFNIVVVKFTFTRLTKAKSKLKVNLPTALGWIYAGYAICDNVVGLVCKCQVICEINLNHLLKLKLLGHL